VKPIVFVVLPWIALLKETAQLDPDCRPVSEKVTATVEGVGVGVGIGVIVGVGKGLKVGVGVGLPGVGVDEAVQETPFI